MRTLHIIMPMAGRGSRFAKTGVTIPKPLIEVDGQPMFMKALSSLDPLDVSKRFTCIVRQEHIDLYQIDKKIKAVLPEVNIAITNEEPIGAVKDASRAEPFLKPDEGVIIADCDIWYGSDAYFELIGQSLNNELAIDGALLTFPSTDPRFSFVDADAEGKVKRTAEKQAISNQAIGGAYYFARADKFLDSARKLLAEPLDDTRPEYYISYLYNVLLEDGADIRAVNGEFVSFGTPEELAAYNAQKA